MPPAVMYQETVTVLGTKLYQSLQLYQEGKGNEAETTAANSNKAVVNSSTTGPSNPTTDENTAIDEAENRIHVQKAIMEHLVTQDS